MTSSIFTIETSIERPIEDSDEGETYTIGVRIHFGAIYDDPDDIEIDFCSAEAIIRAPNSSLPLTEEELAELSVWFDDHYEEAVDIVCESDEFIDLHGAP